MHCSKLTDFGRFVAGGRIALLTATLGPFAAGNAVAEDLISYQAFEASVAGGFECASSVEVRLDAPDDAHYRSSRVERQQLANLVRAFIWIDCPEIKQIRFVGYAGDNQEPVFNAQAASSDDWFLHEGDPPADEPPDQREQQPAPANQLASKPDKTLESLGALAATGDEEAMLELARGLLGKAPESSSLEFPIDRPRGVELLEKLVANGNAEALQLLAEAYLEDAELPLNLSLISQATQLALPDEVSETAGQREDIVAQMTLSAAANGSERAVAALNAAGESGSGEAFLALAQMYTRDKKGNMPYGEDFLTGKLGFEKDFDADHYHQVGLEFFSRASRAGNQQATQLLEELGIEPSERQGQQQLSGAAIQPAASPTGEALAQVVERGTLEEILQLRSGTQQGARKGSASAQPASLAAQSQPNAGSRSGGGTGTGQPASSGGGTTQQGKSAGGGHISNTQTPPSNNKSGSHSPQTEPLIID